MVADLLAVGLCHLVPKQVQQRPLTVHRIRLLPQDHLLENYPGGLTTGIMDPKLVETSTIGIIIATGEVTMPGVEATIIAILGTVLTKDVAAMTGTIDPSVVEETCIHSISSNNSLGPLLGLSSGPNHLVLLRSYLHRLRFVHLRTPWVIMVSTFSREVQNVRSVFITF